MASGSHSWVNWHLVQQMLEHLSSQDEDSDEEYETVQAWWDRQLESAVMQCKKLFQEEMTTVCDFLEEELEQEEATKRMLMFETELSRLNLEEWVKRKTLSDHDKKTIVQFIMSLPPY